MDRRETRLERWVRLVRTGQVSRRVWLIVGSAVVALAVLIAVAVVRSANGGPTTVTVMTRNLYLGADITRPIRATQGLTGQPALLALGHANAEVRDIVARTDFTTRSRLLAAEIVTAHADLVGLQEVALWRHGPLQLDQLGKPNATIVDADFLTTLLAELSRQGATYDVGRLQLESDVEAPAFTGNPTGDGAAAAQDVRLTVADVVLVRHDAGITVRDSRGSQYRQRVDVDLGGVPFSFIRGYAAVQVERDGARFTFVTTHLESQSADVALVQARQLLEGPGRADGEPIVLVCDCNSTPGQPAYDLITRRGGFVDVWTQLHGTDPGSTAVLGETVDDRDARALDRRLDLVLAMPARGTAVTPLSAELTGNTTPARDATTGLWPSDHAGLVVQLRIG